MLVNGRRLLRIPYVAQRSAAAAFLGPPYHRDRMISWITDGVIYYRSRMNAEFPYSKLIVGHASFAPTPGPRP
jgi:hypothetical protein